MGSTRADESLVASVEEVLCEVARQVEEEVLRAEELRQKNRASRFRVLPRDSGAPRSHV
jgi:hypothetical protein